MPTPSARSCQPSRASFWTSCYPLQTGVLSNLPDQGFPGVSSGIPTLGDLFSGAGYGCVHFGKTHDYGSLRGFRVVESQSIQIPRTHPAINFDYETYLDIDTTKQSIHYLSSKPEKPFLMVSDLQNPHNICSYIEESSESYRAFPLDRELPPLPDNFDCSDMKSRPAFSQYLCCAHRRHRQVSHWSQDDFQHYLYAYYYYLSIIDRQIGDILQSLEDNGMTDNTMIVFLADHGEGMAAHHLVTKYRSFYEETNRVPFFFALPSHKSREKNRSPSVFLPLPSGTMNFVATPYPDV